MPAIRPIAAVLLRGRWETFLYTLKAGPAARRRHDGHPGAGLTEHSSRSHRFHVEMLLPPGHALVAGGLTIVGVSGNRRWPVEGTEQPNHNDYVYALRDEEAYLHADDDKPQTVEPFDPPPIVCQFCGKSWEQIAGLFGAKRLIRDPNTSALAQVWICNECVARMAQILAEEPRKRLRSWREWTPGGLMRP